MSQPLGYFDCSQCGKKHPVYQDPLAKNRLLLPTTCSKEVPNRPTPDQEIELEQMEEEIRESIENIFSLANKSQWNEALFKLDELIVKQNDLHKMIVLIRGEKK